MIMKIYFRLVVRLMLATSIICSCSAVAQKQTFDIATYIPPKAWEKQASTNAIQFSKEDKATGTGCQKIQLAIHHTLSHQHPQ